MATGLGWSDNVSGSIIAAQLAAMGQLHPSVDDSATSQSLATAVPQIYRALTSLSEHEAEVAFSLLTNSPCIWTGRGFVLPDKVALRSACIVAPVSVHDNSTVVAC